MAKNMRDDRILYPIYRNGGGVDGRDPDDKGGICGYAATQFEAESQVKKIYGGGRVKEPIVVDFNAVLEGIKKKLTPLESHVLRWKVGDF